MAAVEGRSYGEDTYDAGILRDYYLKELDARPAVSLALDTRVTKLRADTGEFVVQYSDRGGKSARAEATAPLLLNATYASVNQVLTLVNEGLAGILAIE